MAGRTVVRAASIDGVVSVDGSDHVSAAILCLKQR